MPKSFNLSLHQPRLVRGVPARFLRDLIRFLMERARQADPDRHWIELDVLFTDNESIRPYKQASFGMDEVTDVISMTYAPSPVIPGWSGELIVNAERAREFGPRFGGAARELALYLAHGCDHLTGGEDDTPAQRRTMRRRELRWLKEADDQGLLKPLKPFEAGRP
jgi:rRNA maturation RNase YbeY